MNRHRWCWNSGPDDGFDAERCNIMPFIIEKASPDQSPGYVIGLWPLGTGVLRELGLLQQFIFESHPMREYQTHDGSGNHLKTFYGAEVAYKFGYLGILERAQLIGLLSKGVCNQRSCMASL